MGIPPYEDTAVSGGPLLPYHLEGSKNGNQGVMTRWGSSFAPRIPSPKKHKTPSNGRSDSSGPSKIGPPSKKPQIERNKKKTSFRRDGIKHPLDMPKAQNYQRSSTQTAIQLLSYCLNDMIIRQPLPKPVVPLYFQAGCPEKRVYKSVPKKLKRVIRHLPTLPQQ